MTTSRTEQDALVIRAATPADIREIGAIERASFSDPWSDASLRSSATSASYVMLVATRAEAVLGYIIANFVLDEADLANLAVVAHARRSGVGAALVDALLTALAARGVTTVYLEVRSSNAAARALYESRGFRDDGVRAAYYEDPREDAIIMRRVRPPASD